jgi:hypothetical protein
MSETFEVELLAGGKLALLSADEVDRWTTLSESYREDFGIVKTTDLAQVDIILQMHIDVFRAQRAKSGLEVEFDEDEHPTGAYTKVDVGAGERDRLNKEILGGSKEIRALESALGIDKKTRDAAGGKDNADYLVTLKSVAADYGVHVVARTKAIEQFIMDLRWRLRLNRVGDDEDKRYHDCTDQGILRWANRQVDALEEKDKEWAREKGKLWMAKV